MKKAVFLSILSLATVLLLSPVSLAQEVITITNISDTPDPISPDFDGISDFSEISATVGVSGFKSPRPLKVKCTVSILDSQSIVVRKIVSKIYIVNGSTEFLNVVWDGTNDRGQVVGNGLYSYVVSAKARNVRIQTEGGQIGVFVEPRLSVSVLPSDWNIGQIGPGEIAEMSRKESIVVINDGNISCTYSLSLIDPEGWQSSQTQPEENTYILNAAFSKNPKRISWLEANHALSTDPALCTDTRFSGDQTGVAVPEGEDRTLWLQFKSPSSTNITDKQKIIVVITANPE